MAEMFARYLTPRSRTRYLGSVHNRKGRGDHMATLEPKAASHASSLPCEPPSWDSVGSPGGEGADPKPHSFPPTSLCDMCLTEPYVTHHRGMRYCSKCLHVLANRPAIAARELGLTAADDTIRVECLKCGALIRSNPSDEVDRHSARCWR